MKIRVLRVIEYEFTSADQMVQQLGRMQHGLTIYSNIDGTDIKMNSSIVSTDYIESDKEERIDKLRHEIRELEQNLKIDQERLMEMADINRHLQAELEELRSKEARKQVFDKFVEQAEPIGKWVPPTEPSVFYTYEELYKGQHDD